MVLEKLDHYLTPYTKTNSKWIKDLNVIPETIKFLEENIGSKLPNFGLTDNFVDQTSKARGTKAKINKEDYFTMLLHIERKHHQNEKATN